METKLVKKNLWIVGLVLFWLMLLRPVKADVIWEPMGDAFYDEHAGECEYLVRAYTANGPDGKVIVYKSPEDAEETAVIENGNKVYISYVYTDENGVSWGIYDNMSTNEYGWLPMAYMEVVYDYISFEADYGASIKDQEGILSKEYSGKNILIWDYPGAHSSGEFSTQDLDMPTYRKIYVDEEGRSWGKIGYYYGWRNCWICLDAPTADYEELYPAGNIVQERIEEERAEAAAVEDGAAQENSEQRIVPKQNDQLVIFVVGMVAAVVVVTGVLLVVLQRRGKVEK